MAATDLTARSAPCQKAKRMAADRLRLWAQQRSWTVIAGSGGVAMAVILAAIYVPTLLNPVQSVVRLSDHTIAVVKRDGAVRGCWIAGPRLPRCSEWMLATDPGFTHQAVEQRAIRSAKAPSSGQFGAPLSAPAEVPPPPPGFVLEE